MKRLLFALIFLYCANLGYAAPKNPDAPFILTPRVVNVTENSFTVMFQTEYDALCWVEIAPDDNTEWYQTKHQQYYRTVSGRYFFGRSHRIDVSGLTPGTSYRYRVLGKQMYSGTAHFAWNPKWGSGSSRHSRTCTVKTLDHGAAECKFSVVNDIHYDDALLKSLVNAMPADNDFLMLNGDIVSNCKQIDTVLVHTFKPIKETISKIPVFFARGNHEGRGNHWYKLVEEFPTQTGEYYYCFRQGPAAFIVLDAGEDKPDNDIEYDGTAAFDEYRQKELDWLKKVVAEPEFTSAPQKICIMHIPTIKNKNSWSTQKWITENFAPVLEKAGVKLMLSGHHHRYILSRPGENGCAYTVFVNSNMERADVVVTDSKIRVETYNTDGTMVHSLDL